MENGFKRVNYTTQGRHTAPAAPVRFSLPEIATVQVKDEKGEIKLAFLFENAVYNKEADLKSAVLLWLSETLERAEYVKGTITDCIRFKV
jgi:hypothetical protein